MSTTPPRWLSIAAAARYFGVSRATADRLVTSGEWPSSTFPGMTHRRVDVTAIEGNAEPTRRSA